MPGIEQAVNRILKIEIKNSSSFAQLNFVTVDISPSCVGYNSGIMHQLCSEMHLLQKKI